MMDSSKYGGWTIPKIREELKSRGAKLSGRKKELVDRLEAYDRNFNFGKNQPTQTSDFKMYTPEESCYKDIHAGIKIPNLTMDNINSYLEPLGKSLGTESIHLVNERFLRYLKTSTSKGLCFIKCQCWAEMKKTVKYNIDISIDSHGLVDECQCECGAGMGPEAHCKHVNAVLYALFKFSLTKDVLTEETCTQRLQTFHQVKRHNGSPIKAGSLTLSQKRRRTDTRGFKPLNYDPRKVKYIKKAGFVDNFRNQCLNFTNIGSVNISHLFPPANPYGVVHDHGLYTKETSEELYLNKLEISVISEESIKKIETKTRGQSSSRQWIEMRGMRLNSSSFGKICKLTDRTDKVKYASSLTKHRAVMCAAIKHGRKYEQFAIKKFEDHSGFKVTPCGTFVYKQNPFIASTPDGLVGDSTTLEVKCPFSAKDQFINNRTVPYLLSSTNGVYTLNKSHDYYYQVQGQMLCSGRQCGYFCVFTLKDFLVIKIERDAEFIVEMLTKLNSFYEQFFKTAVLDKYLYRNYEHYNFT